MKKYSIKKSLIWVIAVIVLFSSFEDSNITVLVSTGAVVLVSYLVGMIPKIGKYSPRV